MDRSSHKGGQFLPALVASVLLHLLVLSPWHIEHSIALRASTRLQANLGRIPRPQTVQPYIPPPVVQASRDSTLEPPRAEPSEQKTQLRPRTQPAPPREAESQPAPPTPPAPSTPFNAPEPDPATEFVLDVQELWPEEAVAPIDLTDPSIPWHYSDSLWRLPFAIDTPEFKLDTSIQIVPEALNRPVQIAVRLTQEGALHGMQVLSEPSGLDTAIMDALAKIRWTPGEDFRQNKVPTIMILEFSIVDKNKQNKR